MNYFRNTNFRAALACGSLAALLIAGAAPARAQDVEQRYQQAVDLFNNAKMEESCDMLQEIEKEKPGYKQTKTYLNAACNQVKRMVKMEEDLFNEGVQFVNQGRYDDAKQKFDQASKIPLKNPRYRSQIQRYQREIEGRQNEERQFQEAVKLFDAGKYREAQARFSQVAKGGGARAGDARNYLARVEDALRQQPSAKPAAGPSVAVVAPPKPSPQPGPGEGSPSTAGLGPTPSANEQLLRLGLQAYFDGKFDEAERALSDYLNNHGSKPALALFFRGASQGTRYFLSGEKDTRRKDLAEDDFRALKEHAARFQPPQKFVSPKILALYSEAVGAP
jgi:TolA-binding protein